MQDNTKSMSGDWSTLTHLSSLSFSITAGYGIICLNNIIFDKHLGHYVYNSDHL